MDIVYLESQHSIKLTPMATYIICTFHAKVQILQTKVNRYASMASYIIYTL